jgi:hypothetical protein
MTECCGVTPEVHQAVFWGDPGLGFRYTRFVEGEIAALAASAAQLLRRLLREELAPVLRADLGELARHLGTAPERQAASGGPWRSPEQIADDLGIAVATVWSWIRSGALAASQPHAPGKKGRLYFVHKEALDEFMRKHITTTDGAEAVRPAGEAARILGRLAARPADSSAAKPARTAAK